MFKNNSCWKEIPGMIHVKLITAKYYAAKK